MSHQPAVARLFGVINLHKPAGMTSRDVVNVVQNLVRPAKVGHAGTLDPMATGVLLVCIGPATRLVSILQQAPKTYLAEFRLGQRSDTDDSTGQVEETPNAIPVPLDRIKSALSDFCGIIEQTPPAYSAIKVGGQRAYALARQGQEIELQSRRVRIDWIEVVNYEWPMLTVTIRCGSGTYVRSIARDIGDRLGCGGLMTGLVRTAIGEFGLANALDPSSLNEQSIADAVLPAIRVVGHVSQYRCSEVEETIVARGGSFDLNKARFAKKTMQPDRPADAEALSKVPPVALVSACGTELLALAEIRRQGRKIQPRTVFMDRSQPASAKTTE
jgi:tRNA pseudouridine55 synthase